MLNAGDTLRENFESVPAVDYNIAGGQLPDCWEGYSNGMDSRYFPHVTGGGSYNYTVSGTKAITLTSGSGAAQGDTKIVRLPRFAEPISSLTLSYWFCTEGASQGTLSVGYMTGYNFSISNSQYPTTFDVDNLRQGAYFVHLTGAQVNVVKKLIVR